MANYATLKTAIQDVIKTNGNNEITGALLQQSLVSIINSLGSGYQFIGKATPETIPGTPDQRVFYIGSAGTYPNFGPAVVPAGNLGIFYYDSSWHFSTIEFPLPAITESNLATELVQKLFSDGYKVMGIATPGSNGTQPGTPTQNVAYIAGVGSYPNFNNFTVSDGYLSVFKYNGSSWTQETVAVGKNYDSVIAEIQNILVGFDVIYLTQSDFVVNLGLIRTTGEFAQAASVNGRHGLTQIPIGAQKVKITANTNGATYYAFLTSNNLVPGEMAPFVPGTGLVTVPMNTTTGEINIPSGTAYLYIYCSTSNTGTLERFPAQIAVYGSGVGLVTRVEKIETKLENQYVKVINENVYDGETAFGYIGLDGVFNSSATNQHIILPLSGYSRINVRANSNGATYYAFLTSNVLTVGQQAPFAKKTNIVNLAALQSSGIIDIPSDATYLYVFISVSASNWARFPTVNLFRKQILVANPFAVIENDFSDLSIFTGLDQSRLTANGYSPAVGYNNNKVTINRLVTADDYKLCYDIVLDNLSTNFACGSVGNLSNRCSLVSFDFGNGKINFHNPSTTGASQTAIKSSQNMLSVTGNLYRVEIGRKQRNVYAAVTNLTTGIRTEFMPNDTTNQGTAYGWFYDNPTFALISGSCTIKRILETMPTRPFMAFVGDSITGGYGVSYANCWAKKACDHFGGRSFISARSNGTITEMMKKIIEEIPMIKPKFVVLTIGTNGGNTLQNLMQIRDLIKGFGAIPIINCIYQRSGTSHVSTDTAINDLILSLGCLCSRFDLATSLNNTLSQGGNPAYYQSDGIHLNNDGNTAVYERFLADMDMIFTE